MPGKSQTALHNVYRRLRFQPAAGTEAGKEPDTVAADMAADTADHNRLHCFAEEHHKNCLCSLHSSEA